MLNRLCVIWHKIYYSLQSRRLEKAALTCLEAVRNVELNGDSPGPRLALHLSLCESCRTYYRFSRSWRRQLQDDKHWNETGGGVDLDALSARVLRTLEFHPARDPNEH